MQSVTSKGRRAENRSRSRRSTLCCGSNWLTWLMAAYGIATALAVLIVGAQAEDCSHDEFTKCTEPLEMLHITSDFSIGSPAKKDELDKLCHELRKGVRCIQSYTRRCMDLQQRNQFNKLYHGTNQFIRDLCMKGNFQDEYLRHAPCTESAKRDFEVCSNRYKETMVFMKPNQNQESAENVTMNAHIKTICCSINELMECSESVSRKICGPEAADFTRQLVDKYANSLTKIYCGEYTKNPGLCHGNERDGSGATMHHSSLVILLPWLLALLLLTR